MGDKQVKLFESISPEPLTNDLNFLMSFPKEKLSEFLLEVGTKKLLTSRQEFINAAKQILEIINENNIKNIANVLSFMVPQLYPQRVSDEDVIKELVSLGLPEKQVKDFLEVFGSLSVSLKNELRYAGLINRADSAVNHWKRISYARDFKAVYDGENLIGLVPSVSMTFYVGKKNSSEAKESL